MMGQTDLTPKQVIEDIRARKYGIQSDGCQREDFLEISSDLRSAIEQLSTGLYGEDVHFILELIQNAEDNQYIDGVKPDLSFVLLNNDPTHTSGSDGCLCVFNNEKGFAEANVRSICATGKSTKTKAQGYIGEKGIGFKSVFTVSDEPHIISNGYQFKFKGDGLDPKIELAYVVPYWLDFIPDEAVKPGYNTALLLPIRANQRKAIETELGRISPESILFLSRLEHLSVTLSGSNYAMELVRDTTAYPRVDLRVSQNRIEQPIQHYWLERQVVSVPADVIESKREGITEREITVAFPLSTAKCTGTLYAYLPTEIESGLPFLVNADFMLTANRESIQTGRAWSQWLRDEIADVVISGLVAMAKHEEYRQKLCAFVPLVDQLKAQAEFITPVCEAVTEKLKELSIVLTSCGKLIKPEMARRVTKAEREIFQKCVDQINFEFFKLVDSSLDGYPNQLKAIGVRELGMRDIKVCLQDEAWLSAQTPDWFVLLYSYLQKTPHYQGTDYCGLPITKLENGLSCVGEQVPFMSVDSEPATKTIDALVNAGFPEVLFIDRTLNRNVSTDQDVRRWCFDKLGWKSFSTSGYVLHTLLPYLDANAEMLTQEQLEVATKFIINDWNNLNDEGRNTVAEKLPLLLDDGRICRRDDLKEKAIVTPRCNDPELGWQNVFLDEKDCEHFYVLSDCYQAWIAEDLHDSFYEHVGVTGHPSMIERVVQQNSHVSGYEEYTKSVWADFFEERQSTVRVSLISLYPPSSFVSGDNWVDEGYRKSFVSWLEKDQEHSFLRRAFVSYYYYKKRKKQCLSAVEFYLKNYRWIMSSHGLKKTSEIFIKEKSIYEMFGDSLAYLADDISPELCDNLGIKKEVTTETVVDYLLSLSRSEKTENSTVIKLYKYLLDYGRDYKASFEEHSLIYVPCNKKWYKSSEVVWDDASIVMGDMFGWLSADYEKTELREFFVNQLKVRSSVDDKALADAWLNLQQVSGVSADEVEAKLSKIVPKLLSLVKVGNDMPGWWSSFKEEVMLWTRGDDFVSSGDLYYNDNRYLTDLFSEVISFAWIPDAGNAVAYYAPLFDSLGVRPISQSVSHYLEDEAELVLEQKSKILTTYSKRLLAYLVYDEFGDVYSEKMGERALSSILRSVEACVDELSIVYKLADRNVGKTVKNKSGFVDLDKQLVVWNTASDDEEVKDDVAEFIARAIWGTRYRDAEDRVKAILAVASEERFRKLRDKKDWSMPHEIMKEVDGLIAQSACIRTSGEEGLQPDRDTSENAVRKDSNFSRSSQGNNNPTTSPHKSRSSSGIGSGTDGSRSSNSTGSDSGRIGPRVTSGTEDQARRSHSLSKDMTKRINSERQRRVVTYVYSHDNRNQHSSDNDNQNEEQQHRLSIGNAAEEAVVEHEKKYGRLASRMPVNNPGYDIESVCVQTGEARFIEVKGLDAEWGWRGVGISSTQYAEAQRRGDAYWLYVVEHALSDSPQVLEIPNPAKLITEYRFDGGWKQLVNFEQTERKGSPIVEDDISALTDDSVCKLIVEACLSSHLPVPEVGYELFNEDGEVVSEFELAWENYLLAVTIHEYSDDVTSEGWTVFPNNEVKPVLDALEKAYNERLEK